MVLFLVWAVNSSSLHTDNKKKYILVRGEGPTDGHYTTRNANRVKIHQFKAKDSEIRPCLLCLGKFQKILHSLIS